MHRNAENWYWSEIPMVEDQASVSIYSENRTASVAMSGASGASKSTLSGHSKVDLSVAISISSSQERRESIYSDVSSLSKSSVMGFDDLFYDNKRPPLERWQSNDMLFDQSMFPSCPVRRSSIAKNNAREDRPKPARWNSGQLVRMPPRPERKSSLIGDSPTSNRSKMPSPNAKEIPTMRQKVKRAPSRVKSHGSVQASQGASLSSFSRDFSRIESERWSSTECLNASSQHLPAKPTRRSSVVHGSKPAMDEQVSRPDDQALSPSSVASSSKRSKVGQRSVHRPRDRPIRKPSHSRPSQQRSALSTRSFERPVDQPEVPAKSRSDGSLFDQFDCTQSRRNASYSERRQLSLGSSSRFAHKRSGSGKSTRSCDASDNGSIVSLSKLSGVYSVGSGRVPYETKTSDQCSAASVSVGSGLSMNMSETNAPALGKDVQQIRRWANTA